MGMTRNAICSGATKTFPLCGITSRRSNTGLAEWLYLADLSGPALDIPHLYAQAVAPPPARVSELWDRRVAD
jgi:hypothetical protein